MGKVKYTHHSTYIAPSWLISIEQSIDVSISPLDGKLVGVKDNICTSELPTTCGSATLQDFTSPFNATVVDLLENAGAIVAGKTNLDEFGMG